MSGPGRIVGARARPGPRWAGLALVAGLAACSTPAWQTDIASALSAARAAGQDLVVYFKLDGRAASDRMKSWLGDPVVLAALDEGDYAAVIVDGFERQNLYGEWVGGGEGMGVAVLDDGGEVYAARPGPQDPAELAAFLSMCAGSRAPLAAARAAAAAPDAGPPQKHALGVILLDLGCRVQSESLLIDAALAGIDDARHRLARLYALDGNVIKARRWLQGARTTVPARVTEGYVLYKERRYREAAALLGELRDEDLGQDRQRVLLYYGKALHYDQRDEQALPVLEALSQEGRGSTFEAAAVHMLAHITDPTHEH